MHQLTAGRLCNNGVHVANLVGTDIGSSLSSTSWIRVSTTDLHSDNIDGEREPAAVLEFNQSAKGLAKCGRWIVSEI